jgi:hypothetical protein
MVTPRYKHLGQGFRWLSGLVFLSPFNGLNRKNPGPTFALRSKHGSRSFSRFTRSTLQEEKKTNATLTRIAETVVNKKAE